MKTMNKAFGMLALALTFALVLSACPSPSGGGGGDGGGGGTLPPIEIEIDGTQVKIEFTKTGGGGRVALEEGVTYNYVIKVKKPDSDWETTSKGTVKNTGGELAFKPSSGYGSEFTGSLIGGGLTVPVPGVGVISTPSDVTPTEINVSNATELTTAIQNASPGEYVINLTSNLSDFPGVGIDNPGVKITIKGGNHTITWKYDANKPSHLFGVWKGSLVLENISLSRATGNTQPWSIIGVGNGMLEIKNGVTVDGGGLSDGYDGVWLHGGGFIMSGGEITKITNCASAVGTDGTGVAISITGGVIDNNNHGILIGEGRKNCTVTISGETTISNNRHNGVLFDKNENGFFKMTGGKIEGNEKGVDIVSSSGTSVTIAGGEIKGNKEYGVAIHFGTGDFLTMTGGSISGTQERFGLIVKGPNCGFTKTDGIIYGNNAGANANKEGAIIVDIGNDNTLVLETDASGNCAAKINSAGNGIASKSGWDTWSPATTFSQINGTWKATVITNGSFKQLLESAGETWTSDMETNFGSSIQVKATVEYTVVFNSTAKTMGQAQVETYVFSGSNISAKWSKIKETLEDVIKNGFDPNQNRQYDDARYTATIDALTFDANTKVRDDAYIASQGYQINQDKTKLRMPPEDGGSPERILTKQ